MSLQIMTNIHVDFYDKKYIMINAKQYDSGSRWIAITCYNQGNILNISSSKHFAYVRYKKPDEYGVLNSCRINSRGEVLVELTEQMLAVDGICYVDLIIVNKGSAIVNVDTGEIIATDDSPILSTMAFCISVYEAAVDNSAIESSYEYDALNDLLQKANADYTEVIRLAKSYAVGDAGGIRNNEDNDNSKYYYEQSLRNAENAKISEINASVSEQNAKTSETNADDSEQNAHEYMSNAEAYMNNAEEYMDNAKVSETNTAVSEQNAKASETNAALSEQNAKESESASEVSETNAKLSEANAKTSETNAAASVNLAKSYSSGGTGSRDGEDTDNARYYYEMSKSIFNGLNSGFIPVGTISFSELSTAERATGFTYNISDDFITDETFREGSGKMYTAGTNVYYTADGYWDCFGGEALPIATVEEVMNYLGI